MHCVYTTVALMSTDEAIMQGRSGWEDATPNLAAGRPALMNRAEVGTRGVTSRSLRRIASAEVAVRIPVAYTCRR